MGLVAAKCTQCGASIKVDDTKEAGICEYCGTAFITEKAINYYNIKSDKVVVNGENVNISNYDIESALNAIDKLIKSKLYDDARMLLKQIIDNCPYDYRGWWQMALLEYKKDKLWFDYNKNYQRALALSDTPEDIKNYRNIEFNRIWAEGHKIVDFCKNPDVNMLNKIYISVGTSYVYSRLGTKYLGLEIVDNYLKQIKYEERNGNYCRYNCGNVSLRAGISYNSRVFGYFYDEHGSQIPNLYISDIINGEPVFSEIPPRYYNADYIDHIRIIKGDTLINLQPSGGEWKRIVIVIICVVIMISIYIIFNLL